MGIAVSSARRPRRTRRPAWTAALACAAAVLLAACGVSSSDDPEPGALGGGDDSPGTAAAAFDKFNGMTGKARTDALVKAAEEEGTVVFYTASSGMEPVIEAFEEGEVVDEPDEEAVRDLLTD